MDFVLLSITAKMVGIRTSLGRLCLASAVGAVPTLWVLLRQNLYATPWELGLVWPMMMLWCLSWRMPLRLRVKSYLLLLMMAVLAGGFVTLGQNWLRSWQVHWPYADWAVVIPIVLMGMAKLVPKGSVRQALGEEHYGELRLVLDGKALSLRTLWDSGNQLRDPAEHRSVVVVDLSEAMTWLPTEVLAWMVGVAEGRMPQLPEGWDQRLGVASFHSLGGSGHLPYVAITEASGSYLGTWYPLTPVVVALSRTPVSRHRNYHALAQPKILIQQPREGVGA